MPLTLDEQSVREVLATITDPETGRNISKTDQVLDLVVRGTQVSATLKLPNWGAPLWGQIRASGVEMLRNQFPQLTSVELAVRGFDRPVQPLGQIGVTARSVIAVGSGKGGVGKSTIAASLAYGLKNAGCRTGLMDADVYGPSVPHLLGVANGNRPEVHEGKIQPVMVDGLRVMSMGFLVPADQAVVWRGPMLHGAITQFLRDTQWGELDYLIIDMPPGTGDIAITLSQLLPLTGAVIVCTPQDVALLDAVKAIVMFQKVSIPILGMVENMSYFVCPDNGKRYDIFGHGGALKRAAELGIPFLGEVPINIQMRINGDEGRVGASFDDPASQPFLTALCANLVRSLAAKHRAAPPLPTLTVL